MKTKLTLNDIATRLSLVLSLGIIVWLAFSTILFGGIIRTRMLVLKDSSGETRMMLSTMMDESAIRMYGADGSTALTLSVSALGYPSVTLNGPNGKTSVDISTISQGGGAQVSLYNEEGRRVWQIMVDDSGQPRLIESAQDPNENDEDDDAGNTGG